MHGVPKELHRLIAASGAFEESVDNPYDATLGTGWAYLDPLRDLRDTGRPISASIDSNAGTSAGGIYWLCLAQAAAMWQAFATNAADWATRLHC